MYVHFKIRERKSSADFTIIPEIDLQSEIVRKDNEVTCPMIKTNICIILGPHNQNSRTLLCSACLGNLAALVFMALFQIEIGKILLREKVDYKLDYHYIPLDEKIEHLREQINSE